MVRKNAAVSSGHKYEQLYRELKEQLFAMSPGSSFPSVRELMKSHGVSQATVCKALADLEEEKLLSRNVGSGTFVTEEVLKYSPGARPVIGLSIPNWPGKSNALKQYHFYKLKDEYGFELLFLPFDYQKYRVIPVLPRTRIDLLIVSPSADNLRNEDAALLESFGIPFIVFGRDCNRLRLNCVWRDEEFIGMKVARELLELGHRKLALVITEPRISAVESRCKGFLQYCELNGVTPQVIDCGIAPGENSLPKVYRTITNLLRDGRPEATGFFFISEEPVLGAYKAFYEAGVKIPEEVSIIGCGNTGDSEFFHPGLTTVDDDMQQMVRCTYEAAQKLLRNSELINTGIRFELVERVSTAPVPGSSFLMSNNKGNSKC